MINIGKLETEIVNEKTVDIDKVSTIEMLKIINDEDKTVAFEVEKKLDVISTVVDEIAKAFKNNGRLIYIGAGTSGRLGILDASECPPTFGVSPDMVIGLIAGGIEATYSAKEGAEDVFENGKVDLQAINFTKNDVLVGIAASGRTPYVIGAIEYANSLGAVTASICCVTNGEVSKASKIAIEVPVFGEVVTGSTRLKSGTAQKLILNMLTTGAMIKTGKVYNNLMVNVKATNEKLVERAIGIVEKSTGAKREVSEDTLMNADKNVALAIFMIKTKLDKEKSKEILEKHYGVLSSALEEVL